MTNKQKLEHALAFGYPVKVEWEGGYLDFDRQGIIFHTMLNGFKFVGDDSKYDYAYIVSVEPLEQEAEKAENVYEYIRRRIKENGLAMGPVGMRHIQTDTASAIISEAQKKFGDVDSAEPEQHESGILDALWE